jgi:hypothetical protein
MTRRARGAKGAVLVAVAVGLMACPAQQGGPPPAGVPGGATAHWTVPAAPALAMEPVEPGFTHCCGSERFRIEIECGEMLKRCYENQGGQWHQTYGRHCKDELGEACYLQECDAKCQ